MRADGGARREGGRKLSEVAAQEEPRAERPQGQEGGRRARVAATEAAAGAENAGRHC